MRGIVSKRLVVDSGGSVSWPIPVTVAEASPVRRNAAGPVRLTQRDQQLLEHQRGVGPAMDEEQGWLLLSGSCWFVVAVEELGAVDGTGKTRHLGSAEGIVVKTRK